MTLFHLLTKTFSLKILYFNVFTHVFCFLGNVWDYPTNVLLLNPTHHSIIYYFVLNFIKYCIRIHTFFWYWFSFSLFVWTFNLRFFILRFISLSSNCVYFILRFFLLNYFIIQKLLNLFILYLVLILFLFFIYILNNCYSLTKNLFPKNSLYLRRAISLAKA